MRAKKASLIINPRAGENLTKLTDILPVLAAAGWKADIDLKEYGGQTMELATKAAEDGDDLVIAYGGDGTVNQVVNGVMNVKGQHSIDLVWDGNTRLRLQCADCRPEDIFKQDRNWKDVEISSVR